MYLMHGNIVQHICRDPGFKNFLVRMGHSPPRAPHFGIPQPTAESLRKAVNASNLFENKNSF